MCQWKLSYDRYEEIKREICYMYEEAGIDACPIDCFELARRLKYVLIAYSELLAVDYDWAISQSDEGFSRVEFNEATGLYEYVIYYNDADHTKGNIRWTIFHEIGHIYLGHHDNASGNEDAEEDEANFFAKYAIAPPPLIFATRCNNADDIYEHFITSAESAAYTFDYYRKWLYNGPVRFLDYEIELLKLFHFDIVA